MIKDMTITQTNTWVELNEIYEDHFGIETP